MANPIKTIHLLLLEPSSNHAEAIINALRNRGYAVRATQVLTSEELTEALERQVSDCMLAVPNHPDLTPAMAIEQIAESGRDIPCIILLPEYDEELLIEAMNYGAMDAVSRDNIPLLCLKVERELRALETRRKKTQAELALRAAEKRCTLLLDNSQDAIAYIHDGMHVYANNAYLELFGYEDHDELLCIPAMDMIAKESQEEFKQYLKQVAGSSDKQDFTFTGVKADMSTFDAIMTLTAATYDDEACTQVLIRPATDQNDLEEKLKELSAQDTLTDLYNRQYFVEKLQSAITEAVEHSRHYQVLYIEYDQHEKVLSEYGIAGTDQITQDCANWLSQQIDESQLLARIGDHSFGVLLHDHTAAQAKAKATQLCNDIKEHLFDIQGHTLSLTFSIGISPVGEDTSDATEVMNNAHIASTRLEKGDGVKVFNKAYRVAASDTDMALLDTLQEAIEAGRISLLYQPIVKLHGDPKELYQALLQLKDAEGNVLPNDKVFAVAKVAGLAVKIDKWIIAQALKSLRALDKTTPPQLFVALSGASLIDTGIVDFIDKSVKASKLPKSSLIFQIDESDAINHLKRVLTLTADLTSRGYQLCLTDLGRTTEKHQLLEQLPVDYVRIHGESAQKVTQDAESQARLQTLLDEIHSRGKLSIVPQVEEAATLAALWPMNVHYIQGYYLQAPGEAMDYDFSATGF